MAAPMTAAQWRAQAKKWAVDWNEYVGWTTRKRPGSFAPVGIVIHHTGSDGGQNSASYDKFLFEVGRPAEGIPGPLCQAADEMDGDVIMGAIGRANHAGSGSSRTLALVKADKAPLTGTIKPGADDTNGNGWLYGIEVKFDGGQPMTAKQYDSVVRWCAAICDFYGWTAGSIIGHKEWSSRKPDPGSTDMAKFRRDVNARLKAGSGGGGGGIPVTPPPVVVVPPKPTEGDLTVAEADRVIEYMKTAAVQIQDNTRQRVAATNALISAVQLDVDAEAAKALGRYQRMESIQRYNTEQFNEVDAALKTANESLAKVTGELADLQADHETIKAELNELQALVGLLPKA